MLVEATKRAIVGEIAIVRSSTDIARIYYYSPPFFSWAPKGRIHDKQTVLSKYTILIKLIHMVFTRHKAHCTLHIALGITHGTTLVSKAAMVISTCLTRF